MDATTKLTRRDALVAAGAVGAVGAGAVGVAALIGLADGPDDTGDGTLVAALVDEAPVEDPTSSTWDGAPELAVPLLAQQIAPPNLDALGVAGVRVRAVHDGTRVAFRLEWEDEDVEDLDGIGQYHDAIAVMLPSALGGDPPPITMGAPGAPVHILQWRATWQRDVDSQGKTGVSQIYPRVVHDVMPDDVLPPDVANLYWVGREAGNPLSQKTRTTPVEQAVAEGFGSTTHIAREDARGRGLNEDGSWRVALGFPANREGVAAALTPGSTTSVAFAVWLGSRKNRGGRKHYANWVPFRLDNV
jgi:hypothetical protein